MNVAIVGTGYVGLVTGACLAEFGFDTVCVDKDRQKVEQLRRGILPIFEKDLEEIVFSNHERGRLRFTNSMQEAVSQADVVLLAVGTPDRPDGSANLDHVFDAAREAARHLRGYTVVATKSTVPVGTSRAIYQVMREQNRDADFETASNPEFLREGEAVKDFMSPDRIVIGAPSQRSARVLRSLYRPQQLCGVPIVVMDPVTAELSKYACNSFLATKVAFINDVSDMCEALDGDIRDVGQAMGLDTRIGSRFLQPGPGFGGSCFPKDTKAFVRMGQECGVPQRIVEAVVEGNEARKLSLIDTVRRAAGGTLRAAHVSILGLTFKPNTDDVRESPSLTLIRELLDEGAKVRAHDPQGLDRARAALETAPLGYCRDVDSCLEGAEVVAIVTDWPQYRLLHWPSVRASMAGDAIVDFRNLCDPDAIINAGLSYHGIGGRARAQRRDAVYSEAAA